MMWIVSKYLITAALVVLISELAKRNQALGAMIAALPLVTVLTLIWLYLEHQPATRIANHAWLTFWYVLPTLPMFLSFPWLMARLGFWPSLAVSAVMTAMFFVIITFVLRRFGVSMV
ncbi:MAG: DUF3147 family protein [Pseudohongiella sp.]|nr:DUF3147 family protein [Pseudohongiella sp.]